jgi:hypothetical protein
MNEQEFLKLLNAVAKIAKSFGNDGADLTAITDHFSVVGIDSLEIMLMNMHVCDIFKIDDKTSSTLNAITAKEMYDFVLQHHTFMPDSVEAALAIIKKV